MQEHMNIASMPKTSSFQMRINPEVKKRAEEIYANCGMTLTDAVKTVSDVFVITAFDGKGDVQANLPEPSPSPEAEDPAVTAQKDNG